MHYKRSAYSPVPALEIRNGICYCGVRHRRDTLLVRESLDDVSIGHLYRLVFGISEVVRWIWESGKWESRTSRHQEEANSRLGLCLCLTIVRDDVYVPYCSIMSSLKKAKSNLIPDAFSVTGELK